MPLVLHGYRYSVYVRIARLALAEKGVAYDRVEVNPFAADVPAAYLALHPFGRVPTLVHDDFALYETGAITRYLDRSFAGRLFDSELLDDLPPGVDPCGENGEFHSFAFAGPMFAKALEVTPGQILERDGFVFADVLGASPALP